MDRDKLIFTEGWYFGYKAALRTDIIREAEKALQAELDWQFMRSHVMAAKVAKDGQIV